MNQNDLGQEISAASQHAAETSGGINTVHSKVKNGKASKWIMVSGLWLIFFYTLAHFDQELSTLVTSANQGEVNDNTTALFNAAAVSVENFYQELGYLPDEIPLDYANAILIYSKIDDTHYQLMFTFNSIQTINHYAISYQAD